MHSGAVHLLRVARPPLPVRLCQSLPPQPYALEVSNRVREGLVIASGCCPSPPQLLPVRLCQSLPPQLYALEVSNQVREGLVIASR